MAAVTNGFVPCNGRFPTLISLISLFIVGALPAPFNSFAGAALLTALIVLSVFATFAACSCFQRRYFAEYLHHSRSSYRRIADLR